jgi:hypothetical protein
MMPRVGGMLEAGSTVVNTVSPPRRRTYQVRPLTNTGMAMRLSFDLGLHVDSAAYVESGRMTRLESEARQVTFWGCFVVNQ